MSTTGRVLDASNPIHQDREPNWMSEPATGPQLSTIRRMRDEKVVDAAGIEWINERLSAGMTKGQASKILDRLATLPRKPRPARRSDQVAEVGVYELAGSFYAVQERIGDDGKPFRYARLAVITDRRVDFVKAPGMQYRLGAARRLSLVEVEAMSLQFSACMLCGRTLKVIESKQRGIGPKCASKI